MEGAALADNGPQRIGRTALHFQHLFARPEYEAVATEIDTLISYCNDDPFKIVAKMKEIVPEYISNNSVFSALDKK